MFREALLSCGLVDLGFKGNIFMWNNGHDDSDFVQERLDRVCVTLEWQELFSHVEVTHIQAAHSNHVPILITTSQPNHQGRRKKFP